MRDGAGCVSDANAARLCCVVGQDYLRLGIRRERLLRIEHRLELTGGAVRRQWRGFTTVLYQERAGHTLQATALVHEAYLRLKKGDPVWHSEAHFFASAVRTIRRILIEEARRKNRVKRRGEWNRTSIDDALVGEWAENKSPMDIRFPSGHRLGSFRIESLVGEGGMGIVYRARQLEPIERTVAIKMIKPGMDSGEMLRRFQWEHTVLARLEHPHIARVLDAGQTDSGHPYFVMEFVAGRPITDACDTQQLSIAKRLELFEQTCRAVRFAHQHGVLHRDLKPSNLLVSGSEDEPTVKVIDFGVAKLMDQHDNLSGPITRLLRVLGTRPYASPEQIDGESSNIDTRADVFSLGVILYELIIGQPHESNVFDVRREPSAQASQRPSVHFQSFDQATQSRIARQRSTHPADLARFIRSDLDWVLLKAIAPDRTERYGSVEAFVDDLTRFAACLPVRARRQTQFYLARKFLARHRGSTLIAIAFVTAILIALSVTRHQMEIARAAHQRSERLRLEVLDAQRQAASIVQAADLGLAAEAMENGDYLEAADTLRRHHSTGVNPFALTSLPANMGSRFLHDRLRKSGNTRLTLEHSLTALALDHQRRRIAVGDEHGVVTLAGLDEDFQHELSAGGHQEITGLAFANCSSRLFASDESGIVRVFDWEAEPAWRTLYTPEADSPDSVIDDFCISHDDQFLFMCVGSSVQVIDTATGKMTQQLTGHRDSIDAIYISDDGQHIATGSRDHTSAVWRWPGGERILQSTPSEYRVTDVALTAGGDVLVDASVKGQVRWIDVASGKILHSGHVPSAIQTLATNADASEVWAACRTGILYRLTQVESAESALPGHRTQKTLQGVPHQIHLSRVYDCVWLDSSRVLSVAQDGRMVLSDTATEATSYCDALSPNHLIAISADGRWVAGLDQQTIQIIDTGTGRAQSLLADLAEARPKTPRVFSAPQGSRDVTVQNSNVVRNEWHFPRSFRLIHQSVLFLIERIEQ